jgi:hypothetical protein
MALSRLQSWAPLYRRYFELFLLIIRRKTIQFMSWLNVQILFSIINNTL